MYHSFMKKTTIYITLFSVAALAVIYYALIHMVINGDQMGQSGSGNTIAVKDSDINHTNQSVPIEDFQSANSGYEENQDGNVYSEHFNSESLHYALSFEDGKAQTNHMCIPLPADIRAEEVAIENYYMDGEMHIILSGNQGDFYENSAISGKKENVVSGYYSVEGDVTRLTFYLDGVYEYKSILEDGSLYVEFMTPSEVYNKILVIDPGFGGNAIGFTSGDVAEKNLTLEIAQKVKQRLDETDIRVYYTRMDDNNPSMEDRIGIANETKADMYIRIEANYSQDSMEYGTTTVYNENFFIPGFGSVELANILEYTVVSEISGKAMGMIAAGEEDYSILNATVPAATIKVGYLSNAQEAILLGREDYIERIADGIYKAVIKVYDEYLLK